MWLATPALAAPPATWQLLLPAAIAAVAAIATALMAMRGTFRQTDNSREAEFDKQVDADRAALRGERDKLRVDLETMTADRDRYRESYAQLRLAVRAEGLDPDKLGGP